MRGRRAAIEFSIALLTFCLGATRPIECGETAALHPEIVHLQGIDSRDVSFESFASNLERMIGLTVKVDGSLLDQPLHLFLNDVSLKTLLDVALPSQGATWELEDATALRIMPLRGPWAGPAEEPGEATSTKEPYRFSFRAVNLSPQNMIDRLGRTFRSNLVCDYRIEQRPVGVSLFQMTLEEALGELCATWGWQWKKDKEIVVVMPSQRDQLLRFPSLQWQSWVFTEVTGNVVAEELAKDFNIPIHLSRRVASFRYTGQIRGRTIEEIVADFCLQTQSAYMVFENTLYVAKAYENFLAKSNATPPKLAVQVELIDIPADRWIQRSLDQVVQEASNLPVEKMEEKVDQIRGIEDAISQVRQTVTLEAEMSTAVRVKSATSSSASYIVLSGRFYYLNSDYISLSLEAEFESSGTSKVTRNASFEKRTIRLDRPYLYCSPLLEPATDHPSVIVLFLKFEKLLAQGDIVPAVYRPTAWTTPLGTGRRYEVEKKSYYSQFPGEWSAQFLPRPFSGQARSSENEVESES